MRTYLIRSIFLTGLCLCLAGMPTLGDAQTAKIKMGSSLSPPSLDSISPYVAIEKGFFKKNGVEVEVVEFRGDATHVKALLSGDIDVSINMGATEGMVSASKKAPIKLWVVANPITPYHFVARKEAGTTLKALIGKSIAVSGIGAISYHIPRIVLERSGVDPEKFKYVAVGSPADRFKALVAGKVDATVVTNTEAAKLASYPDIIDIVNVPKVVPEIPYEFGMAREDYIAKNGDTIYRLTKAIIEANRWIATNKAGTVEVAKKILPEETTEVLTKAYESADPRLWGVNGDITEASYDYTVAFLKKVGYLETPVPFNQFFDRSFVDRVLKELGRK
ncbi:MAG TPA: ABC transporter substrate-binding protein [Candidatus Acidoferrales bacterium]|nr:ABC transporter substrate-binding protein [Candidatus Acidoferrales bacterium]